MIVRSIQRYKTKRERPPFIWHINLAIWTSFDFSFKTVNSIYSTTTARNDGRTRNAEETKPTSGNLPMCSTPRMISLLPIHLIYYLLYFFLSSTPQKMFHRSFCDSTHTHPNTSYSVQYNTKRDPNVILDDDDNSRTATATTKWWWWCDTTRCGRRVRQQ